MTTIEALMTSELVTAQSTETVSVVAGRMAEAEVGAVAVVEDDTLVGVFTERDLVCRVVAKGLDPAATPVGDVATGDVITVTCETPIRVCAEKLQGMNIRHLPVVDGTQPVGIVSARDFFSHVAAGLESLIERVRYDEDLRQDLDPYDHIGGSYGR